MQRIDENTYIDDTLVTCAEYQLFIDEMREQGKYYQPDHWTSYQFPEGQAKEPILGLYFLGAKDFCEWLSKREEGEWHYRLPTYAEAKQHSIQLTTNFSRGYWTLLDKDVEIADRLARRGRYEFVWIGDMPFNARALNYANFSIYYNELSFADTLNKLQKFDPFFNKKGFWITAQASLQRLLKFPFLAGKWVNSNEITVQSEQNVRKREQLPFSNTIQRVLDGDDESINYIFQKSLDRAIDLKFPLGSYDVADRAFRQVMGYLRRSNMMEIGDISIFNLYPHYTTFGTQDATGLFNKFIIDIYTLNERVAGRSPAFEGLRIVKYRKQS